MAQNPKTFVDIIAMLIELISNNVIYIVIVVTLIIFKAPLSSFISRWISVSAKKGGSEFGVKAAPPQELNEDKMKYPTTEETPLEPCIALEEKDETNKCNNFFNALLDGDLERAEVEFKKYALDEKDEIKLEKTKARYLYLKYKTAKDNSAFDELNSLAHTATNEESKYSYLNFLSFCLLDNMQYEQNISIWENSIPTFTSHKIIIQAVISLSIALNKDEQSNKAKDLIIEYLSKTEDCLQKASLFNALSTIEDTLGNNTVSTYCKDKSLEYDPNNREQLFDSAFKASNEKIRDISISNYIKLINISNDNSYALNNLGAEAQSVKLTTKAIENYKKSSTHKNTLAMANQGFLLLEAGFIEEAEEIANKALQLKDTHKNIHILITAIDDKKELQNKKWESLVVKSLQRQKTIRNYTEQYYLGTPSELEGNWIIKDDSVTNITIKNNTLNTEWTEPGFIDGSVINIKVNGKVSGSTFSGKYTKESDKENSNTSPLLNPAINHDCIGFLTDNNRSLALISLEEGVDFYLKLSR